jgi:hypothetical protein
MASALASLRLDPAANACEAAKVNKMIIGKDLPRIAPLRFGTRTHDKGFSLQRQLIAFE